MKSNVKKAGTTTPRQSKSQPPDSRLECLSYFLIIAIWFALFTGFAEASIWGFRKFIQHEIILLSPHLVWMAPAANLFYFTLTGLVLFLIGRRWTRFTSLRFVTFVYAFLSFASLILLLGGVQKLAALVLATGLAVQISRLIAKHPIQFYALVSTTMGWLGKGKKSAEASDRKQATAGTDPVLLAGRRQFLLSAGATVASLALGVHGLEAMISFRARRRLPTAPSHLPNVLLIVLDTVRAQSMSLYGYERLTTPGLDLLAKSGLLFENAIAPAPWTLPSHASMFTGHYPNKLSVNWTTPLNTTYPTLAEFLGAYGYLTAGFVANLIYCGYEHGLNRGFVHYDDYPISVGQMVLTSSLGRTLADSDRLRNTIGYHEVLNRRSAANVSNAFLRWLDRQEGQHPFFAFLNYFDAHEPYLPPKPFDERFGHKRPNSADFFHMPHFAARRAKFMMSPEDIEIERSAYEGTIAYMDDQISLLMAELEEKGVLENTLVIVTSDHGEHFGDHRLFGHSSSLYMPVLHVPLLLLYPGRVPENTYIPTPVTLRDLPATVADLIGLGKNSDFPGASLARHWGEVNGLIDSSDHMILAEVEGRKGKPEWYPSTKGDMKALFADGLHYILNGDGSEELYEFESDPLAERNLVDTAEGKRMVQGFRYSLETMVGSS